MRTLLFQQVHLKTAEEGRLFRVSQKLFEHYNPDGDMMVIDNASPLDPRYFLQGAWHETILEHENDAPKLETFPALVRFKESVGHPYHDDLTTARDGGGRGVMKAIEIGIANDYMRLGHVEADVLATKYLPNLAPVACLPPSIYGWRDWSAFVVMLPWAHEHELVKRYNWNQPRDWLRWASEAELARICGDDLRTIMWRGQRCEYRVTPEQLREHYRGHRMDWITHCSTDVFREFLLMNEWPDLAEEL